MTRIAVAFFVVIAIAVVVGWRSGLLDRIAPAEESSAGTTATSAETTAAKGVVGVFVEPDDGRAPIIDELKAARKTITVQIYLISDNAIIKSLIDADQRGVRVRAILEENPFGGANENPAAFARLEDGGVEVHWSSPRFRFSHVKTIVVDNRVAIVMNMNLTNSAFWKNREFGAITTIAGDVNQAAAVFESDWNGTEDTSDGPLVVSPNNSRDKILALINGATARVEIYAEVLSDPEIVQSLIAAEQRGDQVRVIVPKGGDEEDRAILSSLMQQGVEIRTFEDLYVHAKMVVADGRKAFVGSQNLTWTSLDDNRELGLILNDRVVVARLSETFRSDFAASRTYT